MGDGLRAKRKAEIEAMNLTQAQWWAEDVKPDIDRHLDQGWTSSRCPPEWMRPYAATVLREMYPSATVVAERWGVRIIPERNAPAVVDNCSENQT